MTDNRMSLFCLVDGEATSNAFPVHQNSRPPQGLIKARQSPDFDDIVAKSLSLWRVSISLLDDDDDEMLLLLDTLTEKKKLRPATDLDEVFSDLRVDIKKITDKFFAPGPIVDFLDAFVKGEGALPITSGSIRGLPRAWRRGFGKAPETRPSLFMDLPDPSTPDSASRNHAAGSILEL
ncbi:hypothetical protein BG011_000730, partial [Mortierella polycephala]